MKKQANWNRRQWLAAGLSASLWTCLPRCGKPQSPPTTDVPWLGEIQSRPASVPADAPRVSSLLLDAAGQPITTRQQWEQRRAKLRQWWLDFLGPLPGGRDPSRAAPPPTLRVLEEDREAGVSRQLVTYEVEPGLATEAYLLRPLQIRDRVPGVAVFHSTVNHTIRQPAGLEGPPAHHFGLHFAQKGCVCLCPRNFLWPATRVERLDATGEIAKWQARWMGSKGMAKMLYDALVAIDILAALPEVDGGRLGAIGHSLGAKEVLYLAAFDERVVASVSSEGGIGTRFSNWEAPWYLGPTIREPSFAHEHHELLALAAPRPLLIVGGESADGDRGWPLIEAALPVWELYGRPVRLGQYNHRQGHAVPPQALARMHAWLQTYLRLAAA